MDISEKSVAEKLLIKPGYNILLLNEPDNYRKLLGQLPAKVILLTKPEGLFDLIQVFVTSRQELEEWLPRLKASLKPNGLLWVTYPKGTSKMKTDVNRDSINTFAKSVGLQGVAMISIDDVWSALRLKTLG